MTHKDDGIVRTTRNSGVIWSSARVVKCSLKWGNERNPRRLLHIQTILPQRLLGRKVRTTSGQHGTYAGGHTHPTMANNNESQASDGKQISKISPQLELESETRLHELGIGSNRGSAGRGEYVLGSCTHRPSSQQSRGRPIHQLVWYEAELGDGD